MMMANTFGFLKPEGDDQCDEGEQEEDVGL